jgi:hypothetical protein
MTDISPQAQADLDALIDHMLLTAHTQLASKRKLKPFAAAIGAEGEIIMVDVPWSPEFNSASRWVADLAAAIRAEPTYRAGAVAADSLLPDRKSSAIRVFIEHVDGVSLTAEHPYRLRRFGKLELRQLQVAPTPPTIWP